jgi:uncharacterized protein DUF4288
MGWYAARMLFLSLINGEPGPEPLYEERVVLLRAASNEDAEVKARRYGVREGHEYENKEKQTVTWILRSVCEISRVEDAQSDKGWEVSSRYLSEAELPHIVEAD